MLNAEAALFVTHLSNRKRQYAVVYNPVVYLVKVHREGIAVAKIRAFRHGGDAW